MGASVVGSDVVRSRSLAAARQLECRKEPADDGEARADKPDGRLDMRPKRGLVDSKGRIGCFDPEEHDDPVDTSETDKST